MKIGKNIKYIRESKGISKEDLAKRSGYANSQYITAIESGKKEPSYEKVKDIANALGVSIYQLKGSTKLYEIKNEKPTQSDWFSLTILSPIISVMTDEEIDRLVEYGLMELKSQGKTPAWETYEKVKERKYTNDKRKNSD